MYKLYINIYINSALWLHEHGYYSNFSCILPALCLYYMSCPRPNQMMAYKTGTSVGLAMLHRGEQTHFSTRPTGHCHGSHWEDWHHSCVFRLNTKPQPAGDEPSLPKFRGNVCWKYFSPRAATSGRSVTQNYCQTKSYSSTHSQTAGVVQGYCIRLDITSVHAFVSAPFKFIV